MKQLTAGLSALVAVSLAAAEENANRVKEPIAFGQESLVTSFLLPVQLEQDIAEQRFKDRQTAVLAAFPSAARELEDLSNQQASAFPEASISAEEFYLRVADAFLADLTRAEVISPQVLSRLERFKDYPEDYFGRVQAILAGQSLYLSADSKCIQSEKSGKTVSGTFHCATLQDILNNVTPGYLNKLRRIVGSNPELTIDIYEFGPPLLSTSFTPSKTQDIITDRNKVIVLWNHGVAGSEAERSLMLTFLADLRIEPFLSNPYFVRAANQNVIKVDTVKQIHRDLIQLRAEKLTQPMLDRLLKGNVFGLKESQKITTDALQENFPADLKRIGESFAFELTPANVTDVQDAILQGFERKIDKICKDMRF